MVDALIRHWVVVVARKESGTEDFGRSVQTLSALLYADNGILAYPWPSWIQDALDVLTGLFGWVMMRVDVKNMVVMTCPSFRLSVQHSVATYEWQMMEEVPSYRSIQRDRAVYP